MRLDWLLQRRPRLPTLVIIGAMKCGTSSLHRYLDAHPEISMSATKETDWFLERHGDGHDLDWYRSQFDPRRPVRGETSPNYTKRHLFPGVPERMHAVIPDARLVYLVRDPVERAISNFVHSVDKGRRRPDEFASMMDPRRGRNVLLETSRYHHQLSAWLELWSLDDVLVLASEDLRHDRRASLRRVFRFLGVDETFDSPRFDREAHVTARKLGDDYQRPRLSPELRARVEHYLRDDVAALRELTGQPFEHWSL